MKVSVEDSRTGKIIKLDVKEHHIIERIIEIVIKHMGFISSEQRSYALVFNEKELPNSITIKDAIHKFGLKEFDRLILWTKVIGG
ncbi:MAG: hypothetical protein EAX89_12590 [Candidatus Lokiarchaeota archaeon]|jgi:hypothetical protein|nr:hypothetical protein [Candidatus Lokiarchaeota archaeon]